MNPETSLLSAAWRYRWLVTVVTGFCLAVGLLFHLLRPQEDLFEATATIVIQQPIRSVESVASQGISEQFFRSQLEIMRSPVVFEAAAETVSESGFDVEGDVIAENVEIIATPDSPLVTVTAQAPSPGAATALANGMAEGYREVSQRQASATAEAQLARIDAQVAAIDERLAEIDAELSGLISDDPALARLQEQADTALESIAELQANLLSAPPEERETIRTRIDDLRQVVAVYREVGEASAVGPEEQALMQEQTSQVDRRATLLTLRDEVAVDAGIAPDAVALVRSASVAEPVAGVGLARIFAVALIVGLALGVGLAYFLTVWRRTLVSRSEPASVLGAPLLADVPDFEAEHLSSPVPARDHPRSAAAEAFRFASASAIAAARGLGSRSIFMVSTTLGHGKTTTAVNAAISAAIQGRSVVIVDCDFGNQEASRLLLGDGHSQFMGLTDAIEGVSLEKSFHNVDLGEGVLLSVLPRGTRPSLAASVLQSQGASHLFESLAETFDLVLIDGPPLLQVAYASTLAELAEALVVVVEHQGSYSQLVDLTNRLQLIDTPVLGYVYNRSPLRREMTMSDGSMMDILGDSGFGQGTEGLMKPKRRV